jgi:hypothetical protein
MLVGCLFDRTEHMKNVRLRNVKLRSSMLFGNLAIDNILICVQECTEHSEIVNFEC